MFVLILKNSRNVLLCSITRTLHAESILRLCIECLPIFRCVEVQCVWRLFLKFDMDVYRCILTGQLTDLLMLRVLRLLLLLDLRLCFLQLGENPEFPLHSLLPLQTLQFGLNRVNLLPKSELEGNKSELKNELA